MFLLKKKKKYIHVDNGLLLCKTLRQETFSCISCLFDRRHSVAFHACFSGYSATTCPIDIVNNILHDDEFSPPPPPPKKKKKKKKNPVHQYSGT